MATIRSLRAALVALPLALSAAPLRAQAAAPTADDLLARVASAYATCSSLGDRGATDFRHFAPSGRFEWRREVRFELAFERASDRVRFDVTAIDDEGTWWRAALLQTPLALRFWRCDAAAPEEIAPRERAWMVEESLEQVDALAWLAALAGCTDSDEGRGWAARRGPFRAPERETVDGRACWRIEAGDERDGVRHTLALSIDAENALVRRVVDRRRFHDGGTCVATTSFAPVVDRPLAPDVFELARPVVPTAWARRFTTHETWALIGGFVVALGLVRDGVRQLRRRASSSSCSSTSGQWPRRLGAIVGGAIVTSALLNTWLPIVGGWQGIDGHAWFVVGAWLVVAAVASATRFHPLRIALPWCLVALWIALVATEGHVGREYLR